MLYRIRVYIIIIIICAYWSYTISFHYQNWHATRLDVVSTNINNDSENAKYEIEPKYNRIYIYYLYRCIYTRCTKNERYGKCVHLELYRMITIIIIIIIYCSGSTVKLSIVGSLDLLLLQWNSLYAVCYVFYFFLLLLIGGEI